MPTWADGGTEGPDAGAGNEQGGWRVVRGDWTHGASKEPWSVIMFGHNVSTFLHSTAL